MTQLQSNQKIITVAQLICAILYLKNDMWSLLFLFENKFYKNENKDVLTRQATHDQCWKISKLPLIPIFFKCTCQACVGRGWNFKGFFLLLWNSLQFHPVLREVTPPRECQRWSTALLSWNVRHEDFPCPRSLGTRTASRSQPAHRGSFFIFLEHKPLIRQLTHAMCPMWLELLRNHSTWRSTVRETMCFNCRKFMENEIGFIFPKMRIYHFFRNPLFMSFQCCLIH